jgi:3-dehydroquinate synthase
MTSITSKAYTIHFEGAQFKALKQFLKSKSFSSYFILCDENTLHNCLPLLITACPVLAEAEIIEIESGETNKSLDIASLIWQSLLEQGADRSCLLINLGGGVVSDLGGFCASVYKRGIPFIHIPTSSLAMADASVGGKTGIDFAGIKNSIGTFQEPEGVFIYTGFLQTLPLRHLQNGLAEIYKIALIADKKFWAQLSSLKMDALIHQSVVLKNKIVLKDPKEKNLRKVLNFGHSLGHALEAHLLALGVDILHGEAIVAGMIMETHVAWQKKLITAHQRDEICFALSAWFELPEFEFTLEELLPYLKNDKKNKKESLQFALVSGIGKCDTDVNCTLIQIKKAITFYPSYLND